MAYDGCVLCGNPRHKPRPIFADGRLKMATSRNCPVCGEYDIATALDEDITARRADFDPWLPGLRAYTRQQSAAGGSVAMLSYENFKALAAGHLHTPVATKLRLVLEYLASRSQFPGDTVGVGPDDYPLFDVAQNTHVMFLLETLEARVDLRRVANNNLGHPQYVITAAGWDRLTPATTGGVPGTVFVAHAFSDDMQAAFDAAIQPAIVNDCGLTVTQVSRIEHNDSVTDLIIGGIRAAQVVVADVTHQRNGVYFEGGFGMGLGRVVIWMCSETDIKNVHFDTSHYNHIVWKDHEDLRAKLKNRLRATMSLPTRG